jgi:translation initiation factor 2-alpha kinase 3
MELCRSETLRHWLNSTKSKTRSHTQILNIFEQILNAINYIHSQDLIHRDLKPSNILLSLDGNFVKIGDFGLVVSVEENPNISNGLEKNSNSKNNNNISNDNNGTYLYMSPEQLKHKEYSSKVDIFSLGIILYELIVSFETDMERYEVCFIILKFNL